MRSPAGARYASLLPTVYPATRGNSMRVGVKTEETWAWMSSRSNNGRQARKGTAAAVITRNPVHRTREFMRRGAGVAVAYAILARILRTVEVAHGNPATPVYDRMWATHAVQRGVGVVVVSAPQR